MRAIQVMKWISLASLSVALMFTSAVFTVLVYGKITGHFDTTSNAGAPEQKTDVLRESDSGQGNAIVPDHHLLIEFDEPEPEVPEPEAERLTMEVELLDKQLFEAPLIQQYPELPRGCEVTTLTMLLQYKGLDVDKMTLYEDMPKDDTPIQWGKNGIAYWGNPQDGFVGDITLKSNGFGIYHKALFKLLVQYDETGIDMTGESFDQILMQVSQKIPVMVWVTTRYNEPDTWVEWDSPSGLVRTTHREHTVLIVGYDEDSIYINDPLNPKPQLKVDRASFIKSWEALGQQALSYTG